MNRPVRSAYPVLLVLGLLVLAPMAGLLSLGQMPGFETDDLWLWQSAYIRRVLWFSLLQAGLSTILSVVPAILIARALFNYGSFPFRSTLLRLFALPLVVPSVVAVMGIVSVYGSHGAIPIGKSLYGLNGILLAHVFFNLPLAVRLLLPLWQTIPAHHWQLGEQLEFNRLQRWRYLEWPLLRESLPGVMLLVFMLCLTSFAVVLTLGGGPRSTTLEVAIYQSLRSDFDPVRAVSLALLQLMLCSFVALITLRLQKLPEVEITIDAGTIRQSNHWISLVLITVAGIFVAAPLVSIFVEAMAGPVRNVLTSRFLWQSALYTLTIGGFAALFSILAGWLLLRSSSDLASRGQTSRARWIETCASIVYVVPPLVIGTGLFVLMSPHVNVFNWVLPIVILVNSLMGLPFVIRTLGPAMRQHHARHHALCQQLALTGWNRWRWIDWPLLRRPTGLAAALVAALAMGDLGVIALFGTSESTTLPLLVYQQLGAYQIPEATVTAAFLLLLCLLVFWLLERGLGGYRNA
jgi:thiamine transport system permease protein